MTDMTDIQRISVRSTAQTILDRPYDHSAAGLELASFVINNVDAPDPTLAEELARIAENSPVWTIQNVCDELKSAANRAEQVEKERDEARAEAKTWREQDENDCEAYMEELKSVREALAVECRRVEKIAMERDEAKKERDHFFREVENVRNWKEQLLNERDEARAEVERVRDAVDPKGAGLPPGMTISEAVQTLVDGIPTGERMGLTDAQLKREYDLIEARAERDQARSELAEVTNARDSLREEFDHARTEVERLTADRLDRNPETKVRVEAALNNLDQVEKVAVQKGAESNAETPDPAEVKPGEAWVVECRGERRTAVKDNDDDVPWNTINADGWYLSEENETVTLITRLVPAPRVTTNPDDLEELLNRSVVLDGAGHFCIKNSLGLFSRSGRAWITAKQCLDHGPVTVLLEPEA